MARFFESVIQKTRESRMNPNAIPRYKWVLATGDYICIVTSFLLAMLILPGKINVLNTHNLITFALFAGVWVFTMEFNNLYQHSVVVNRSQHFVLLVKAAFTALMITIVFDYFTRPENWLSSRSINATVYPIGTLFLAVWRLLIFRRMWIKGKQNGRYQRRMAIIGTSARGVGIAKRISYKPDADLHVVGFIDDDNTLPTDANGHHQYKILGTKRDLKKIARQHRIDKFIIAGDEFAAGEILELAEECTTVGAQVDVASETFGIASNPAQTSLYQDFPVVHLHGSRHNLAARILKRAMDIVLVSFGLIVLAPVFAALATAVKLSSPGPVIYRSRRVGKNGEEFDFFKFRSMRPATEQHDPTVLKEQYEAYIKNGEVVGKIINDNRVTRIGKLMRKTSLDELPQLWNVLKGDMSLVGPRPCLPTEYQLYSSWHKKRLNVTPGCTGLWQVSDRKKISFNDMVLLDYYYMENMSLWFDLQIILKTIPVMIFGKGDM